MFIGLLVLRRHGGGTIGLSRLLWKQVWAILTGSGSLKWLILFFFHKGVVWLALAVATEIPPLVSPASLLLVPFMLIDPLRRRCSLC
jgi:hypothetical protein